PACDEWLARRLIASRTLAGNVRRLQAARLFAPRLDVAPSIPQSAMRSAISLDAGTRTKSRAPQRAAKLTAARYTEPGRGPATRAVPDDLRAADSRPAADRLRRLHAPRNPCG